MKKFLMFSLSLLFLTNIAVAQKTKNTIAELEYKKYVDTKLNIDYRKETIKAMDLTVEESAEFYPLLEKYMKKKENLLEKRIKLVENFREEMAEDDSKKDEDNERADYIEKLMELSIAEQELRKDIFDKMEDRIPVRKAAKFFFWEQGVQDRMYNDVVSELVPQFNDIDYLPLNWNVVSTGAIPRNVTADEYRRYVDAKLDMKYRNTSIQILDLTKEEISAFDPVFNKYMAKKDELLAKRMRLLEDFRDEIAEDDSKENEAEDRADFIEDYWEVEIAEQELAKDFFDVLEDEIPVEKAAKFFLWENAIENRMAMNIFAQMIPSYASLDRLNIRKVKDSKKVENKLSASCLGMVSSFDTWVTTNKGKVSLSHDYTSDGLTALVNTMEAVKNEKNLTIPNFDSKKAMILQRANQLTLNEKSNMHADYAKEAFVAAAEMMKMINKPADASQMKTAANSLNKKQLLTKQAETVYQFFDAANEALQQCM